MHQVMFVYGIGLLCSSPKITIYPNKEGKPNDVNFVGRSSITQGVRTIYADRIRMTMTPKDFHAEGNTRTVIKNIVQEIMAEILKVV